MMHTKLSARALVIAAHPDDEVLGAGATIARWVREGTFVTSLILSEGISSRREMYGEVEKVALTGLKDGATRAHEILGDELLPLGNFPDNSMDTVPLLSIAQYIEGIIDSFQPDCVLTHGPWDVNVDHRLVHEAVLAATRPQPNSCVKVLAFFPILSSTEWRPPSANQFAPTLFVDVTGFENLKAQALEAYAGEMRKSPHPRSVEVAQAQMTVWGSVVGVGAAEAFQIGRIHHIATASRSDSHAPKQ
jgi:LmbE family N-acetylglucosaminyl deacetylase